MEASASPSVAIPDRGHFARLSQKCGAEMVGTFALVFVGCGAMMVDTLTNGTVGHVGVGLSFGLVVMVMVYATGHISGAHFNPAVTIAFAASGRFPWREVPFYILGQCAAATAAAFALRLILGDVARIGATSPAGAISQSFVLEVVLTFFLMFVIIAVASDARASAPMAGVAIGGTVALAALFGGPISGASMNPARSLGPGMIAGEFDSLWLYFVAPILGAGLGAWCYGIVRCEATPPNPVNGCC